MALAAIASRPDREQLGHAVIADHGAHRRLGHQPERLVDVAQLEEILVGVGDLVLDDPLDGRDVQIAGQHQRLGGGLFVLAEGAVDVGANGAEAELLLELALDRDLLHLLDAERESWLCGPGLVVRTKRPKRVTSPTSSGSTW